MGSSKKNSNNNPSNRNEVRKVTIKTSWECSQCKSQCARGISYLDMMSREGAKGNGVPCVE